MGLAQAQLGWGGTRTPCSFYAVWGKGSSACLVASLPPTPNKMG